MNNRIVYKLDQNKAKETKQRLQEEAQRNQLPMWKIPEGESRIRILPPWSSAGDIAFDDITLTECFTSDGIPLMIKVHSLGYVFSLEAKSVSRNVQDSELELPYQAKNLN